MASMKDVSRLSGVNVSTISRYLSGKLAVRSDTEARILHAIEELGYRPNLVARALKTQETYTIGVVVPTSTNPLFAEIVAGAYSVLSAHGYAYIQTASENDAERELGCFQLLCNKQVDGLIIIGSAAPDESYDEWAAAQPHRPPTVFINRRYDAADGSVCVLSDFDRGSLQATEYFLSSGRRRVAMITGIPNLEESVIKERGYRQCLHREGIAVEEALIRPGYFSFEGGYRAAEELLRADRRPDAILAVNDLSAIAALSCAARMGLRVPDDLAVIGYGNSEASAFTAPTLSTIDQQKQFGGQRGAQLLLDLLSGKAAATERIKTSLLLRESS